MSYLKNYKVGFIGCGNLAQSILQSVLTNKVLSPGQIYFTNRSEAKKEKIIKEFQINYSQGNDELIEECDIVVVAVKPQDFYAAVEPYVANFTESHVVISLAAGINFNQLSSLFSTTKQIVRVMTNTASSVSTGVLGYLHNQNTDVLDSIIQNLFSNLGDVYKLNNEDEMGAFTVATSSGVGFAFEIMTYWTEWLEEYGIDKSLAEKMIVQTFLGASKLANSSDQNLTELQKQVVSKKGVTQAGLDSMCEMELDRVFRVSFEKAVMRDKELGKQFSP